MPEMLPEFAELNEQLGLLMQEPREAEMAAAFPLRPRLLRIQRSMRAKQRSLLKAENADGLINAFPEHEDESVHALLAGDFVLGNLIDRVRELRGEPKSLWVATLSVSLPNVETLKAAGMAGVETRLFLSHYFQSTEKELFAAMQRELGAAGVRLYVARCHAKVLLLEFYDVMITITTSANLRSSNNLEQADIFADPALFLFHRGWMQDIIARAEAGSNPTHAVKIL